MAEISVCCHLILADMSIWRIKYAKLFAFMVSILRFVLTALSEFRANVSFVSLL